MRQNPYEKGITIQGNLFPWMFFLEANYETRKEIIEQAKKAKATYFGIMDETFVIIPNKLLKSKSKKISLYAKQDQMGLMIGPRGLNLEPIVQFSDKYVEVKPYYDEDAYFVFAKFDKPDLWKAAIEKVKDYTTVEQVYHKKPFFKCVIRDVYELNEMKENIIALREVHKDGNKHITIKNLKREKIIETLSTKL